jgi:hypothetical protein
MIAGRSYGLGVRPEAPLIAAASSSTVSSTAPTITAAMTSSTIEPTAAVSAVIVVTMVAGVSRITEVPACCAAFPSPPAPATGTDKVVQDHDGHDHRNAYQQRPHADPPSADPPAPTFRRIRRLL